MTTKPSNNKRKVSKRSCFMKVESLVSYVFSITKSDKQFPRAYRPTLVNEIQHAALNVIKNMYAANSINPVHQGMYKDMAKYQQKAVKYTAELSGLLSTATYLARIANPEELAKRVTSFETSLINWIRYTKRKYKKLPTKKKYNAYISNMQYVSDLRCSLHDMMPRDNDGFIILKHK